jgi:hypothetical protein
MTNNISLDSTPSLSTVAAVVAAVMVVTAIEVVMVSKHYDTAAASTHSGTCAPDALVTLTAP